MPFSLRAPALLLSRLALATILFAAPAGLAAGLEDYSETEKAGFAFHSLSGIEPDFEAWITESERYYNAYPREKIEMLQRDIRRLQNGFSIYQPDSDLIDLRVPAVVESSQFYEQSQLQESVTDIRIKLKDLPENYFPFQIGDLWVAIVIKDFDTLNKMSFDRKEYKEFLKTFNLKSAAYQRRIDVNIDMKLRPLSVDTSAPLKIEGIEMWLMLAEIADMQFWKGTEKNKEYLWRYSAPWYVSEDHKELLRLYSR